MKLTEKHIECAKVCARLEISGQNTKKMARKCGGFVSNDVKLVQNPRARCKAVFRVDLSDIPLTHRGQRRDSER